MRSCMTRAQFRRPWRSALLLQIFLHELRELRRARLHRLSGVITGEPSAWAATPDGCLGRTPQVNQAQAIAFAISAFAVQWKTSVVGGPSGLRLGSTPERVSTWPLNQEANSSEASAYCGAEAGGSRIIDTTITQGPCGVC